VDTLDNRLAALRDRAKSLYQQRRFAESLVAHEEALRLAPGDAAIHFFYAGALLRLPGRTADAVAELDEVLRLQPDNEAARRVLARIQAAPK